MKKIVMFMAISFFAGLSACGGSSKNSNASGDNLPEAVIEIKSEITRIENPAISENEFSSFTAENNRFTWELYNTLSESNENLFFSPFSITSALAMTYVGAEGNTKTEMAQALNYTLNDDTLHAGFNRLLTDLESRNLEETDWQEALTLNISNAVWPSVDNTPSDTYLDTLALNYGIGVYALDYENSPDESRLAINDAVLNWTEGLVQNLLPEGSISSLTELVLTNTIYMYAPWSKPFDELNTQAAAFSNIDTTTSMVDTMRGNISVRYSEIDGTEFFSIPYRGEDVELFIMLPSENSFASFESNIDQLDINSIYNNLDPSLIELHLPKFSLEYNQSLKAPMGNLGMIDAFSDKADFSSMGIGNVLIDDIYHKAVIELHETGTEAAAATAVVLEETSLPLIDRTINVDRPFIFTIVDRPTGANLFVGKVVSL